MLSQEILWESLHSMNRSQQKYNRVVTVHEFLINVLETLSSKLATDPFELILEKLNKQFSGIECFIIEILNNEYGRVIKSTQEQEEEHLWPLIGPLRRPLNNQPCIVFNAQLTPVLKSFPPVLTHHIVSMLMSLIELNQSKYMLLITHHKVGHFDDDDQYLLDELARLLSQQRDRFRFSAMSPEGVISTSSLESLSDVRTHTVRCLTSQVSKQMITQTIELNINESLKGVKGTSMTNERSPLAGRYELIEKLGHGGQGSVYHAYDHLLKRSVAIKMADREGQSSKTPINQLIREASLAANIHHPNVVQIFDIGFHSQEQIPFIVMEYLIGKDLGERLAQRGPFPLKTLIPLMIPVLEALGQAHSSNLVHRDLKPQNLFLVHEDTPQEHFRILDFGIAQLTNHQAEDASEISGTLSYLAPEYLKDQITSTRVDVYQMGLIFIELLVGQKVFNHDSYYKVMLDISDGNFEIPSSISDQALRAILNKSTALNPSERYADCHEFAEDLKVFMQSDSSLLNIAPSAISSSNPNHRGHETETTLIDLLPIIQLIDDAE